MTVMIDNPVREYANAAAREARVIKLSVLIPFYKDDPADLVRSLAEQAGSRGDVEILLHDDGEPDPVLNAQLTRIIAAMTQPVRLLTSTRNRGRSGGRNLLAQQARGAWLLYLDADMQPGHAGFLDTYREVMAHTAADAVFGGYETDWPEDRALQLHAALSRTSDQNDAEARNAIGASAFCASNILVRAEVMDAIPYDTDFTGWGWEDVDWAVRAAARFNLQHVDNPAAHGGLQDASTLLAKFKEGAINYKRLLDRNPELASLPGARTARLIGQVPGQGLMRGLWSSMSRMNVLPLRLRTLALKLWRASWTAEVI
ncbi:glycosyltransferase family 2 protein [Maricaulis parjimensis]|uniref:glycosyltransferase family 2 protein n=1 Tax=Maricaulis parjimensis TaxID=144023 RepID=UPI00193A73DE|nr:glycosyltransferase family A protein [Maricaulis parjimensis]